jgi:hypothetical protein
MEVTSCTVGANTGSGARRTVRVVASGLSLALAKLD